MLINSFKKKEFNKDDGFAFNQTIKSISELVEPGDTVIFCNSFA